MPDAVGAAGRAFKVDAHGLGRWGGQGAFLFSAAVARGVRYRRGRPDPAPPAGLRAIGMAAGRAATAAALAREAPDCAQPPRLSGSKPS